MELRQLEAFVEAARRGSVSRAAEALYLTQPSLTQRVRALEMDLGQQLLVRAGRGVRLTPAGRLFLPRAEAALAALSRGAEEVKTLRESQGGRLALAAVPDLATYVLPRVLGGYHRQYSAVELVVHAGDGPAVAGMVAGGHVELGLADRPLHTPDVVVQTVYEERIVPIAAPDHPLAAMEQVTLASFAGAGLVVHEPGSELSELTLGVFAASGVVPRLAMRTSSTEMLKRMIAAGLGVALAPELTVREDLAAGRLALVPLEKATLPRRPISILQAEGARPSGPARAFLDLLVAEAFPRRSRTGRAQAMNRHDAKNAREVVGHRE